MLPNPRPRRRCRRWEIVLLRLIHPGSQRRPMVGRRDRTCREPPWPPASMSWILGGAVSSFWREPYLRPAVSPLFYKCFFLEVTEGMTSSEIVVVGASAGGVDVLRRL